MIIRNNASHQRAPCSPNHTYEQQECAMRVVLADDHPIVLGGLRALLQAERGVEIVAAALDGATAQEMIRAHEPEIAVLDITMPRLTGLVAKLGLMLNEAKTSVKDARRESFDFLGYTFGPQRYRKDGHWYLGASPSKKSVQRIKTKVGDILVSGNKEPWPKVCHRLNRLLLGWSAYF